MDMWKPRTNTNRKHAPQAAILYDKFHMTTAVSWANAARLAFL